MWSVGQKREGRLVEVLLVVFSAVVQSKHFRETGEDLRVNVRQSFRLVLHFVQNLETIVVLAQTQSLVGLRNATQKFGIALSHEANLGLIQKLDRFLDVLELATCKHGENSVLDGVEFARKALDHLVVERQQVCVRALVVL